MKWFVWIGLAALGVVGAHGQALDFEAASVKPSEAVPVASNGALGIRVRTSGGPGTATPGRITYMGQTLLNLMMRAWDVKAYQISGPSWLSSDRFDVIATLSPEATREQFQGMLRKLLTERFEIVVHKETHEFPLFALVVSRGGAKLKEGKPEAGAPGRVFLTGNGTIGGKGATVGDLAVALSAQMDRPVKDETGLAGTYDFTLTFAVDETQSPNLMVATQSPGVRDALPDTGGAASLFTAIQQQLGLKLEAGKGPVEMVVIDRAVRAPAVN